MCLVAVVISAVSLLIGILVGVAFFFMKAIPEVA